MRVAAVFPRPTGTSFPVPASGSSASSGTSPEGLPVSATTTRFSTHPLPCGEGKKAGSPIDHHTSRPNGSPNPPARGFHALVGGDGTPTLSQPFHGKSRSFTVRG